MLVCRRAGTSGTSNLYGVKDPPKAKLEFSVPKKRFLLIEASWNFLETKPEHSVGNPRFGWCLAQISHGAFNLLVSFVHVN